MNAGEVGPTLRSRGLLIQSAATAQSTMDFSTMAVDDGVVNSPGTSIPLRELVQSPSPVWPRSICHNVSPIKNRCARIKRVLYDNPVDVAQDQSLQVSFFVSIETYLFDVAVILMMWL